MKSWINWLKGYGFSSDRPAGAAAGARRVEGLKLVLKANADKLLLLLVTSAPVCRPQMDAVAHTRVHNSSDG